ncbi:conserved hypothetical protein [Cyanobium sp. PCC 7001]|uniref:hypothetical protein n=1 Tax=Cyanobium sp. PCC 7001 TaxID=180281 RepID=UPI000180551E|nr:hypothetical protein [Cyanobium sp. PCC 7001]EDY38654.1 conserved hypothetical protein [Cyanobium sp. PCC 7001]
MQLQARLVHAEPGSRVVEVSAHRDGALLASALGEGPTAEAAEDRALERLQRRLREAPLAPTRASSAEGPAAEARPGGASEGRPEGRREGRPEARPRESDVPKSPPQRPEAGAPVLPNVAAPGHDPGHGAGQEAPPEPPPDPEDWSGELAQIDLQLRRLDWQREQEGQYLLRAFGHPSRSRLTTYADLLAYLQALTALPGGSNPDEAPVPLRRRDLLAQCDQLLAQLGWDAQRGRRCLEEHFGQSSRQQLSDAQLLQFNMVLEEAVLALSGSRGG